MYGGRWVVVVGGALFNKLTQLIFFRYLPPLKNYKNIYTMSQETKKACLFCNRDENEIPLVGIDFKNEKYWICPQHIPVLIHDPQKLSGMLPGAENMEAG